MQWSRKLGLGALLAVQTASAGFAASFSQVKLIASDAAESDRLGYSIAVAGNTLVVSSINVDFAAGAAYVFQRDASGGDDWVEVQKLMASDSAPGARLGQSVGISGDTIVVGAESDADMGVDSGSAYLFERNWGGADNWGQLKKLNALDAAEGDQFGHSVAIDGDTIVVGADGDADAGPASGSAYVFERNWGGADNWGQLKKLNALDAAEGDQFGQSVGISGNTVVVGADGDADMGDDSGSAYLFERDWGGDDNWGQLKKLNASDQVDWDHFGWSVAIDGERVVIGMYGDDDPFHKSGSAYLFERNFGGSDNWGEVKKIQAWDPGELEYFGRSVSVNADWAVASSLPSSVHLFDRKEGGAGNWGQIAELGASDVVECTVLDGVVSISGSTIAMGARCDSTAGYRTGAAYVYTPVTTSLPTMPVSGLALLGALILVSGVGAHWALAGRRSLATSRGTGSVGRLARQGTTSRPR